MKLMCCIVSRKLAATSSGDALPKWVTAHIAQCEHCAAEAKAYGRLMSLLADGREDESNAPEWEIVRSRLAQRRASRRPSRSILLPIGATAIAAATLALLIWPKPTQVTVRQSPIVRIAQNTVKKAQPTEQKKPTTVQPTKPKAATPPPRITQPSRPLIRMPRRYKPSALVAKATPPQRVEQSAAQAPREVAVIDMATRDREREDSSAYVIQTVSADDAIYTPL